MRGVTKRFPGVVANDDVSFEVARGEVHALLGENGAGKTTLMNVLTGLYRPDEGDIEVGGRPVELHSPRDAIEAGIGMVHQHFRLVETLTVAENIALADRTAPFLLRGRDAARQVELTAEALHMPVDPGAKIWQLSVGEQQRVEIMKAVRSGSRVLILDEPTAVLTPQEAQELFRTLRVMAAEGHSVVVITHKLHEVMDVADRVTVLRGGRSIATVRTSDVTRNELASLMVGRDVEPERRREPGEIGEVILEAHGLSARGDRGVDALRDVSFSVRAGEVLGVAGVAGNGQRELAEVLTGMRPASAGVVEVEGKRLRDGDPRAAIRAGVAHVPEDRLRTGVAPSLSIASNVVLKSYRGEVSRGPFLLLRRIAARAAELIRRYDVRGAGPHAPARLLSGGNLQKVVLAREFSSRPKALVVAAPTRGLDVGAIETVHGYLRDAAADGVAVLARQRGPRRAAHPRRPDRRDVRGRDRRARSTRAPRASRRSGCSWRASRDASLGADRAPARPAPLASRGRPDRLARRRVPRDRRRAARHRARAAPDVQAPVRRGVRRGRGADEHAHLGDAARLHGPRGRGRVPDAPLQHRRRRAALLRRDRGRRHRAPPRGAVGVADHPRDDRRRRGVRRCLGGDPGRAAGVRPHQRDHHVADAQLRRGARPQLPDLRQPLLLARHVARPGSCSPRERRCRMRRPGRLSRSGR